MKRHLRKAVLGATAVVALAAAPAPAYATVEAKHCLHPPYTVEMIGHCACIAVGQVVVMVLPDSWSCA